MDYAWYDFVGNLGVAAIILTYLGIQLDWMSAKEMPYLWLNLVGAIFILISLIYSFNLSSFVIEIFWIAITVIGIIRRFLQRK